MQKRKLFGIFKSSNYFDQNKIEKYNSVQNNYNIPLENHLFIFDSF